MCTIKRSRKLYRRNFEWIAVGAKHGFVTAATGFGKGVIIFLFLAMLTKMAVLSERWTLPQAQKKPPIVLLICLLVSLCDQHFKAASRHPNVTACWLGDKGETNRQVVKNARSGRISLLVTTPEWLKENKGHEWLDGEFRSQLCACVLDESDCVTVDKNWHPAYGEYVTLLFSTLPSHCLRVACSATHTEATILELRQCLRMQNALYVNGDINRPDLFYRWVKRSDNLDQDLADLAQDLKDN
eukprot:g51832.t1